VRILRVAQKLYPEVPGGGPYHVHAMSRDQAAMGHDVTVLTVTDDDSLPRREQRDGYTVVRRKPTVELLGNEISAGVAQFLRDADDFDVVHAHSHLYFSTNLTALKRWLGETPLAITNHGLYSQNAPEWVFDAYLRTVGRWTFNQADVVFCYTEVDKKRVLDLGVRSQIKVVPNGIDTERFTPTGPESKLIDAEGPVVLFVGRFAEGKRPWLAVEAFAEVLETYPGAKLYLCGDGGVREELEAQVEDLGIEESVTFLGHVPYNEMPKVYRSGDVLVLPSRAEGVPRTVLEAMASGLEIVMSDLEQVAPTLGERGHVVADSGDRSFADGLIEAIEDSSRESGQLATDDHRWADTVKRTTRCLQSIAGNNS